MKVFPFLRTVLDEVLQEVPATSPVERQAVVEAKAKALRDHYGKLAVTKEPVDYKDPATRYAYIRGYVASHANMVSSIIGMTPELQGALSQSKVGVCCIGGGPGSDLVGVLKYVESAGIEPKLMFWLFDREQAWSDSWADVNDKLDREVSTYFIKFDVTDPESYSVHSKYLQSDLFTMVYFLSEVHHCRDGAAQFFNNLFAKAKKGALFLYIDNSANTFYEWFDGLWKSAGLKVVSSADAVTMTMPYDEQKSDLGSHLLAMTGAPKLQGNIAYRVLKKE